MESFSEQRKGWFGWFASGIKQQRKINQRQSLPGPRLQTRRSQTRPQRLLEHTAVCLRPESCSSSCILFLQQGPDNIWLFIALKPLSPLRAFKVTANASLRSITKHWCLRLNKHGGGGGVCVVRVAY